MDSNLLAKNEAAEVDTSVVKISVLAFLAIAVSAGFGYFARALLKTTSAGAFTLAGGLALLFIVIFFFQSIFIKGKSLNLFIILGETIALSLFFLLSNYSFIMIIAVALVYLALYSALKKSKRELENQLKISIIKIAKISVPKIAVALTVLISVVYSQPFYPDNMVVSKGLINSIISPSETLLKLAHNYLPAIPSDFSVNMTLLDVAKNITSASLKQLAEQNNVPLAVLQPQMGKMTESTLEMLKQQAGKIGLKINSDETILDAIYNYINGKLGGLSQGVKWALFGTMFLLVFLSVKSLFWLFYWLIYLFIFLFYEISLALGFSRVGYEQISKEVIIL